MKHYPRIILFPVTTILCIRLVSRVPDAEQCNKKSQTNLRIKRTTQKLRVVYFFLCYSLFSFNISVYIFLILRSAAGMPGPRGASILHPKMSDIMPLPNLKQHYAPLYIWGEGEGLLSILQQLSCYIFASISVRQLELTVSNHAENAPPPSIHVTTASRGKQVNLMCEL